MYLNQLKEEITQLGEKVKGLKTNTPTDTETIAKAVQDLLAAKRQYAEHNNGIGVDGKPYVELTKAQQKKKNKQQQDGGQEQEEKGSAKQESDPNSINAQKKAAKKAAKKAQKSGGADGADPSTTPENPAMVVASSPDMTVPSKNQSLVGNNNKGPTTAKPVASPMVAATVAGGGVIIQSTPTMTATTTTTAATILVDPSSNTTTKLLPLQVAINPNLPMSQRPLVTISVAVLTDTIIDLDIVSDHKCRQSALGLLPQQQNQESITSSTVDPSGTSAGSSGGTLVGDLAMARYWIRHIASAKNKHHYHSLLGGASSTNLAIIDSWVDYAQSLSLLDLNQRLIAVALALEHSLYGRTYLVGNTITLADLSLFAVVGFPTKFIDLENTIQLLPSEALVAQRWIRMMAHHMDLQVATQLCMGVVKNAEGIFDPTNMLDPLVSGMNTLEGAIAGRVVTRFPPEPSGYLHIGHAKAVLLNDYYARRYKGRMIVRFDDTNPSKEKEEYQQSIVSDLARLGVRPDLVTYTSDYFEAIAGYAKVLIASGLAYMDDTPQEQMKIERAERIESKHRGQTPTEALHYFDLMCSGVPEGSTWCLRARMDMKSDNGTMRDPVIFRQNLEPHHRSGTKFHAYPTYDLACPIVDSLEGVTHALRTTEYNDRDEQYQWLLKALGLRRVRIHAFSRVNFKNTVLSKRKLTWFVENGHVTGWDDARMPTIRGVVRRGVNVSALKSFIYSQGASRNVVLMDWKVFWSENKKELDKTAKRFMAIDKKDHVRLVVTGAPKEGDFGFVETTYHPKDPTYGKRAVRISSEVLLETADAQGIQIGETIVLMRWGVVKITKVDGTNLEGDFVPDGDFKLSKRKLSWIANVSNNARVLLTEFDNLVSKDKLEEEDNFMDFVNPNTFAQTEVIGDAGLKTLNEHEVIQLERRGFYRVDRPYVNQDKPLVLYMIPDGKDKAMSGVSGKLAHR